MHKTPYPTNATSAFHRFRLRVVEHIYTRDIPVFRIGFVRISQLRKILDFGNVRFFLIFSFFNVGFFGYFYFSMFEGV